MDFERLARVAHLVALLAEGVDRNRVVLTMRELTAMSPSSRRAWIEMLSHRTKACVPLVALLTEGVDRNFQDLKINDITPASPSSRRAWIEMQMYSRPPRRRQVALLAEGVDRNTDVSEDGWVWLVALLAEGVDRNWYLEAENPKVDRRPPRGGRG